jgi:hypothetical protein
MLLLIASISLVPFLLAWVYYRHPDWVVARSNYGNLISPARPLSYADLLTGAAESTSAVKGRWILLQLAEDGDCGLPCRKSLIATRQIRLLLNKDIPRVRRLFLKPVTTPDLSGDGFDGSEDLTQAALSPALLETLTSALGRRPEAGSVLLIDPFANLMMWYPPDFDRYGVLRDLKHLLRSSQIG